MVCWGLSESWHRARRLKAWTIAFEVIKKTSVTSRLKFFVYDKKLTYSMWSTLTTSYSRKGKYAQVRKSVYVFVLQGHIYCRLLVTIRRIGISDVFCEIVNPKIVLKRNTMVRSKPILEKQRPNEISFF